VIVVTADFRAVDAQPYIIAAEAIARVANSLSADAAEDLRMIRPVAKSILDPAEFESAMVLPDELAIERHGNEKIPHEPLGGRQVAVGDCFRRLGQHPEVPNRRAH
jgi:hypothetical protein